MKLRFLFILFVCFICTVKAQHTYPNDSTFKVYRLKDNYRLAYKHYDSINFWAIQKDTSSIELAEGEADAKMPIETLGYLYADFDNYFAIATHLGASPIKISIYEKKGGGLLMYGLTPFYLDTIKGLLMYEGAYGKKGKLILFNASIGKAELYDAPTDTPCFGYCCWKVINITDRAIEIEYINMDHQSAIKLYPRKKLSPP